MVNIRTIKDEHDYYCGQPEGGGLGEMGHRDGTPGGVKVWGSPGDVRKCIHGYIMMGYEVPGVIPCYWRTLRWWTYPLWYRRAVKALKEAGK